ncbi:MAG: hypothetical protein HYR55_11415 [Acidobacteria bacterium]|nr:hypothetical protein [Acidobacteriota bacterium]
MRPTNIKPTQDCVNSHLYYGVRVGDERHLVRSDHTVFSPADWIHEGLHRVSSWIPTSDFSQDGLSDYMTGKDVPAAAVYQMVRQYVRPRVVLIPDSYYTLVALWVLGTYLYRLFRTYPYLWVHGLHPRCGKTLLLETVQPLVFSGVFCVDLHGGTLRGLADSGVTLLIDDWQELRSARLSRAVLTSGFRDGLVVPSWEPAVDGFALRRYTTYSPKVIVGCHAARETLWDIALPIGMVRKEPTETISREGLRVHARDRTSLITDGLYIFGLNYAGVIAERYPQARYGWSLKGARDRERDLWQPLFVLAQLVDQEQGSERVTEALLELR